MSAEPALGAGDWPRTTRLLPWLLAAFLVLIWIVPVGGLFLPGAGARLDLIAIGGISLLWLAALVAGGPAGPRLRGLFGWSGGTGTGRVRRPAAAAGVAIAAVALLIVAGLSVAAGAGVLSPLGELALAGGKLIVLLGYVAVLAIVATSVRPVEARRFGVLIVALSCVTAVGVIYEYRTGTNLFYQWASVLPVEVTPAPEDPASGRENTTGPTPHALAIATMLALALPFAISGLLGGSTLGRRLLHALAIVLILTAALATVRKTGALAPAAVLLVLLAYRPRAMLRALPVGVLIVGAILLLAPGALQRVKAQFLDGLTTSPSSEGRKADFDAVGPDLRANLALGRGYGSYDATTYRYIDNQYLKLLIETGVAGLIAYLALLGAVIAAAHRRARSPDPVRGPPALAAIAGAVAFGVVSALFDVLAFVQPSELFFFVAGLALACTRPESAPVRARAAPPREEAPAPASEPEPVSVAR